MHEDQIWNILI